MDLGAQGLKAARVLMLLGNMDMGLQSWIRGRNLHGRPSLRLNALAT